MNTYYLRRFLLFAWTFTKIRIGSTGRIVITNRVYFIDTFGHFDSYLIFLYCLLEAVSVRLSRQLGRRTRRGEIRQFGFCGLPEQFITSTIESVYPHLSMPLYFRQFISISKNNFPPPAITRIFFILFSAQFLAGFVPHSFAFFCPGFYNSLYNKFSKNFC